MQTAGSRRRAAEAGTSNTAGPQTRPSGRGMLGEELTPENMAIMAACEAGEAWQTLRNMRPDTEQKFMSAICILVQEIVEDNGFCERNKIWAKGGGKTNQIHASFIEPLTVSWNAISSASPLRSLCGNQKTTWKKNRQLQDLMGEPPGKN